MEELDSQESFRYLWYHWRFTGIHPYKEHRWLYRIYAIIVSLLGSIASPFFAFAGVFFLRDIGLVMHNLQISVTLVFSTLKQCIIHRRLGDLDGAREYLAKLDKRASANEDEVQFLKRAIRQCHWFTLGFLVLFTFALASYAVPGYFLHIPPFEGWFPLDWTKSEFNFYCVYFFQTLGTGFQVVQNAANDGYPLMYLNIFKGHIHVLRMRISRIGKDPKTTQEENYEELKNCINDYKIVIGLFHTISPVISETVFVQFVITALVLCSSVVYYLIFNREVGQFFSTIVYMIAVTAESFPVCYFGNAVIAETDALTTAIYSCNWIDQSQKFRRCMIIFMQRTQKTNIIMAFLTTITLKTFNGIIQFSFSVFTVLKQLQ